MDSMKSPDQKDSPANGFDALLDFVGPHLYLRSPSAFISIPVNELFQRRVLVPGLSQRVSVPIWETCKSLLCTHC